MLVVLNQDGSETTIEEPSIAGAGNAQGSQFVSEAGATVTAVSVASSAEQLHSSSERLSAQSYSSADSPQESTVLPSSTADSPPESTVVPSSTTARRNRQDLR